jgi:F-type H+-transporting ATPase subunit epsilon
MATLRLEIVSLERLVYSDEVSVVIAPGIEGQLGILPNHAPLMTFLEPGELIIRKEGAEISLAISGGFLEVFQNKVTILADTAERAEEIDIARVEEAKRKAEETLKSRPTGVDLTAAEAALKRSLVQLKVAGKRKRREVKT